MPHRYVIFFTLVFTFTSILVPGCVGGAGVPEDDDDNNDNDNNNDNNGGDSDADSDSDAGGAPKLASSHPGWKQPNCWQSGCHSATSTHNSDKDPYECVACHGNNGTTSEHNEDLNCSTCHGKSQFYPSDPDHQESLFPDNSCPTCH